MAINFAVEESAERESVFTLLDEVQHITDETSLLALNAVLEAARVGESGRDFADEVRQLLLSSNKLNNEIQSCVSSSQSKLNQVSEMIDNPVSQDVVTFEV